MGRAKGRIRALNRIEDLNQRNFSNDMALKRHQATEDQRSFSNDMRKQQYEDTQQDKALYRDRQNYLDQQNEQRYNDNKAFREKQFKMNEETHAHNRKTWERQDKQYQQSKEAEKAILNDIDKINTNLVNGVHSGNKQAAIMQYNRIAPARRKIRDIVPTNEGWQIIRQDRNEKPTLIPTHKIKAYLQKGASDQKQQFESRKQNVELKALERKNKPKQPNRYLRTKDLKENIGGLWNIAKSKNLIEGELTDNEGNPTAQGINFKRTVQEILLKAQSRGAQITPQQAAEIAAKIINRKTQ